MPKWNLALIGVLVASACAPAAPAPETAAAESGPSEAAPAAPAAPEPVAAPAAGETSSAEPATAAASPPEPPAPDQPSVVDICLRRCDRLANTCSKTSLDACRADCGQWKTLPAGCEKQIRVAVQCMADAPDAQCANVAPPSCGKQFRAFTRCKEGKPELEPETSKTGNDTAGLSTVEDAAGGFKVLMPGKPTITDEGGHRVWRASNAAGVSYEVHKLPPMTGKLTPKAFLKVMSSFLGPCAAKMRLHGMIDTPDYTLMRFETKCKDGIEWRGAIHAHKPATYIVGLKGEGPKLGQAEAVLGSFQVR